MPRRIEFLVAWDDNSWETMIEEVPDEVFEGTEANWANTTLASQSRYRRAVLFAVYNEDPDEGR